ncbi:hypothetical protein PY32053_01052 [Paracoccus yeei]|uniref:Glycosyltransferase family 8 protein n=1 Tax=Paracoccus yeei TaxID=147645 RepID=A0A386UKN2_9RHOB|nr:hypothetical protein PY32053_01052 [Paracoccus yeei]
MTLSATFSPGFQQRSDLAVVVAADETYLPYAATPALALAGAGPGYDVLIGGPRPAALPQGLMAAGIGHVAACDSALADSLPLDKRRSIAAYMTLFLGTALNSRYRRILVLDADILYERGDIARLLASDIGGRAVAAVRDNRQWRTPRRKPKEFRKLREPAHPYFNSGVVLIDTQAFLEQDIPAQATRFARQHHRLLSSHDQSLLNGILKGDWTEMSPLWNWQFTGASAHLTCMADPCLIHFIGKAKPWLDRSAGIVPMRMRDAFGRVLDQHFPDAAQGTAPEQRHWPDAGHLRRALFRQWRAAGPMLRYLGRFPDPYTMLDPRA